MHVCTRISRRAALAALIISVSRTPASAATASRPLSPFYYYTKNYQGGHWSHPGNVHSHLKFDIAHHGFSDFELRGLAPQQMERLHSAHHQGLVAPGLSPAGPSSAAPRDDAQAFRYRGSVWFLEENFAEALADYQEALRLDTSNAQVHSSLAWFFASCPDARYRNGDRAVEFARRACESSNYSAWYQVNTLAAAYAEAGEFDQAVAWGRKALDLAPEGDKPGCAERLQLYTNNTPLRRRS